MAAIDDSWRQFRNSLNKLVTEDMSKAGVHEDLSVADIIGHVTTWEWELITSLDRGSIEPVANVEQFNATAAERKKNTEPRQIVEDMEKAHRSLRDELAKAPSAYFEPDDPFRDMIDSCTVLHYQDHGAQIRIWAAKHSVASARN